MKKTKHQAEQIISESLKFHGLLTPNDGPQTIPYLKLPEHLKQPDFLFERKTSNFVPQNNRMAAFKSNKKKGK